MDGITADGWVRGMRRLASPNWRARPPEADICLAVVHGISLPPKVFGGDAIMQLFTNTLDWRAHPSYAALRDVRVSAHFLIRRDGDALQFVSVHQCAWHAGESSWRGQSDCNDFSVGIELEGCDDAPYADEQYDQLGVLLALLIAQYPRLVVVGHADIAPGRKTDPGAAFEWRRLFADIGEKYDGR